MKKPTLEKIHKLHQAGHLKEARTGYLALLRVNPRNVDILHALGILYTQEENFSEAVDTLQKAIRFNPKDPILHLHLANVLKFQGLFNQAAIVLENTIEQSPHYIPAYNNLGTVYYAQGKLDSAIALYRQAIAKQENYIDAYYNLGLALAKKNLMDEALTTYKKILEYTPEHFAARFQLACVLMQQENIYAAFEEFLTIEAAHPYHFETQTNLATCYLKQGAFNEAKSHYLKALELRPEDTQILFNLGFITMQQGYLDSAIPYYQRVVKLNPDFFAAHNNLGVAFLAKQHVGLALQHFQEALRIQPNNHSVAYTIKTLSQNQRLLAAPPDYVQSLFDAYADHYETHLLNALDYQLPQQMENALAGFISVNQKWDILDLGCGTGLCGKLFKPYAKSLYGVDLSTKMLEVANQKKIYDELITADITTFLINKIAQYDLIIAADVLVYVGELENIFQSVASALRERGLFIFNTEISESSDYRMNQSGRFSHNKLYLDQLAANNHFKTLYYKACITRMQNNEPVYGHLYVLQCVSPIL